MKHYLKCKAHSPCDTSACIFVPAYQTGKWRHLLADMQLMKQFAKGSMLFAQAGLGGGVKALGPSPLHRSGMIPLLLMVGLCLGLSLA